MELYDVTCVYCLYLNSILHVHCGGPPHPHPFSKSMWILARKKVVVASVYNILDPPSHF